MYYIDLNLIRLDLLLPIFVILVVVYFATSSLRMPEEYYKNMQIREAILKRRAEKEELEKIEARRNEELMNASFDIDDL